MRSIPRDDRSVLGAGGGPGKLDEREGDLGRLDAGRLPEVRLGTCPGGGRVDPGSLDEEGESFGEGGDGLGDITPEFRGGDDAVAVAVGVGLVAGQGEAGDLLEVPVPESLEQRIRHEAMLEGR